MLKHTTRIVVSSPSDNLMFHDHSSLKYVRTTRFRHLSSFRLIDLPHAERASSYRVAPVGGTNYKLHDELSEFEYQ